MWVKEPIIEREGMKKGKEKNVINDIKKTRLKEKGKGERDNDWERVINIYIFLYFSAFAGIPLAAMVKESYPTLLKRKKQKETEIM